jgi:hypothetical protein
VNGDGLLLLDPMEFLLIYDSGLDGFFSNLFLISLTVGGNVVDFLEVGWEETMLPELLLPCNGASVLFLLNAAKLEL